MAEVDAQAYAVTSLNAAAGASNSVETQQPGGSGALRQTMVIGDPTTRGNMATVGANGQLYTQGYQPAATTFSAVTATGALTSTSAAGLNIATVTLRTFTGTTPSITFRLEASDDNTNWVILQGINNATGQVGSTFTQASALTAGTAGPSIDYTVGAYTNVRVNVTAISGASATAAFGLALQTMPYEASPGALVQMPLMPSSSGALTAAAASSTSLVNTTSVVVAPVNNAASATVTFKGTYSATMIFEGTDDGGTTWYAVVGARTDGSSSEVTTGAISNLVRAWKFDVSAFTYFRVRCSTFVSGSVTVNIFPTTMPTASVSQLGQGNSISNVASLSVISNALPTGTNAIGNVGVIPRTSGGSTTYTLNAAASTNAVNVKSSGGQVYSLELFNNAAYDVFFRFYNLASAPTVGTSTIYRRYKVPANGGMVINYTDMGIAFSSGISIGTSKLAADTDTTVLVAGDLFVNIGYN